MNNVAEDFLSRILQEKFWKYIEVKACLLKESKDRIWKVAFIQIQLLKESQVNDEKQFRSKNLMLIRKILDIESLRELVVQISEHQRVRIYWLLCQNERPGV